MSSMPSFRRLVLLSCLTAVVVLLAVAPVGAQVLPPPVMPGGAKIMPPAAVSTRLESASGQVDVLVTLNVSADVRDVNYESSIRAAQDTVAAVLPRSAKVTLAYSHLPILSLRVDSADLQSLTANPLVASVSLDRLNETMDSESNGLTNAPFMHGIGYTGMGVRAAIVDTGIDTDHPSTALIGDLFFQHCFRTENDCPNGDDSNSAEDQIGHGTHVAGIITGSGGVAPDVEFAALKVFSGGGFTSDTNILNALNYIVAHDSTLNIDMVNMSLGQGYYSSQSSCDSDNPAYVTAFSKLNAKGITVFVATGNASSTTTVSAPACVTGAIGVGSQSDGYAVYCPSDSYGTVTCFSNATALQGIGELVDVLAPGCSITSEFMGGGYANMCGTSMATPTALGVAALIKQVNPALTPGNIETILETSGDLALDTRTGITYPAVNAKYAYGSLVATAPAGLSITNFGVSSTTLGWSNVADEDSYVLERSTNGEPFVVIANPVQDSVAATDSALACGHMMYRLRSVKGNAISLPSDTVSRVQVLPCPAAPSFLTWEFVAPDDFQLDWNTVSGGVDGYVIERSENGGADFAEVGFAGPFEQPYVDTSTTGCANFVYRLRSHRTDADFASLSLPSGVVFAGCPPANDLFANAEALSGTSDTDTEPGVSYARIQLDDVVHGCRYGGASTGSSSVWYTFTPAAPGHVHISTVGSTYDTTMSIVTGAPGSFMTVACNDDINPFFGDLQSDIKTPVAAGVPYYVMVSAWTAFGLTQPTTLQFSFALDSNLLDNGGFDNGTLGGVPVDWSRSGKGSSNDKNQCKPSAPDFISYPCTYKFKGSSGESSVLKQKVSASELFAFGISATPAGAFAASVNIQGTRAAGSVIVKIKYNDGTPANKVKTALAASPAYTTFTATADVNSTAVVSVTVEIQSKAKTGKTYADNALLIYNAAVRRDADLLPPPPAPEGFRGSN